jgi:hypothetical protein
MATEAARERSLRAAKLRAMLRGRAARIRAATHERSIVDMLKFIETDRTVTLAEQLQDEGGRVILPAVSPGAALQHSPLSGQALHYTETDFRLSPSRKDSRSTFVILTTWLSSG